MQEILQNLKRNSIDIKEKAKNMPDKTLLSLSLTTPTIRINR
jgi:hypothetical protein